MVQELTGQEIVSEITSRLRTRFNTDQFKEIYKDKPVQGMKQPCIFVESITSTSTPMMNIYSNWRFVVNVRCHPAKMQTDIYTWARTKSIEILSTLKYLKVSNQLLKSVRTEWRVVDDVLHITLTYSFRVMEVSNSPRIKMQGVDVNDIKVV